jgi:hypothetical protein
MSHCLFKYRLRSYVQPDRLTSNGISIIEFRWNERW